MSEQINKALIIFIKTPALNSVKTRLQTDLDGETIVRLYTAFLSDLGSTFNQRQDFDVWYAIAPENFDEKSLTEIMVIKNKFMQSGADLGQRMKNAFHEIFIKGYRKVLLIGSDIPYLSPAPVNNAFDLLQSSDCVLGPSSDGGYYLIGMKKIHAVLFHNIAWSSDSVYRQTTKNAKAHHITVDTLSPLDDIDTFADLKKLFSDLTRQKTRDKTFPSHTWKIMTEIFKQNLKTETHSNKI